ncbi:MAG: hypothetical protein K0R55_4527 [Sporomusa sp.]|jgi:hypothetical protein|nr:hypothetical protein [Sporomusa sp.]
MHQIPKVSADKKQSTQRHLGRGSARRVKKLAVSLIVIGSLLLISSSIWSTPELTPVKLASCIVTRAGIVQETISAVLYMPGTERDDYPAMVIINSSGGVSGAHVGGGTEEMKAKATADLINFLKENWKLDL